jgi:homoserine kinase
MATASAVASSGNIGPGFDVVALALDLRCEVDAEPAAAWSSAHVGPHAPDGGHDLVLQAAKDAVGEDRPLHLTVTNHIPLARGLGSSAAAYAAGVAAALRAVEGVADPDRVFEMVAAQEGHADNAAAAVYGGLVGILGSGRPTRFTLASDWRVVAAIPSFQLLTKDARGVLPADVHRSTVVRSLSRLIALIEGLRLGDAEILAEAGGDELHEAPRDELHPLAAGFEVLEPRTRAGRVLAPRSSLSLPRSGSMP